MADPSRKTYQEWPPRTDAALDDQALDLDVNYELDLFDSD